MDLLVGNTGLEVLHFIKIVEIEKTGWRSEGFNSTHHLPHLRYFQRIYNNYENVFFHPIYFQSIPRFREKLSSW